MNRILRSLTLVTCLVSSHLMAADGPKTKVLDAFNTIDPKTLKADEMKIKVVSTPDPIHHKALEMVVDFAKPGAWPKLIKSFPAGTINPKKYSGIRFFAKSDTATKIHFGVIGPAEKDGKPMDYRVYNVVGKDTWTEFSLPFNTFKFPGYKAWKNGQQMVIPPGATLPEESLSLATGVVFSFRVEDRGNSTVANFMVDGLELIER